MTNSDVVTRIVNGLKATSKDLHISKRYILNIAKTKAKYLMTQKLDEGTLFREEGIISTIECFKMKSVDVKSCDIFEFRLCENLMKSCEKIPEGLFGKNGSGILSITNIDGSISYTYVSPRTFSINKKRKHYSKKIKYYYIKDGYLYLPDSKNEIVEIRMFSTDKSQVDSACGCKDNSSNNCKSYLELDFVCSDRLLDSVIRDTIQEVASIYRTSQADENPNMDENQKTQTTQ